MNTDNFRSSAPMHVSGKHQLNEFYNQMKTDLKGNTPLILAARIGHIDVVYELVERHLVPVNTQNYEGTTALAATITGGFYQVAKYLLEHGADVNLANLRGETPLMLAVALNNIDIISLLLNEGSWLECEDECGDTALMFAIREDNSQAVEALLLHGADVEHSNDDDETPAMLAEMIGASDNVRDMLSIYAGRDVANAALFESGAMVPDGNANGALGTSYEMKVHFSDGKTLRSRSTPMVVDESDSSCAADATSLHQSASHSPMATAMSSQQQFFKAPAFMAGIDRARNVFIHPY